MRILKYGFATAYLLTSSVLFYNPELLHRKKVYSNQTLSKMIDSYEIMRFCHRGGCRQATQNTIQAFQIAVKISDGIEFDICQTKDGVLVVHHDIDLQRTCGVKKYINDLNYEELPHIQPVIKLNFAPSLKKSTTCEKISTLEEVFLKFPSTIMNIQLKTPNQTAQKQMTRLIRKYKRQDRTIVGVKGTQNSIFKQKNPDLLTFFQFGEIYRLFFLYITGLLPFFSLSHNAFEFPILTQEYIDWKFAVFDKKQHWKIYLLISSYLLLNLTAKPLVLHLKRRGILSIGWVCNQQQHFKKAQKMGVQGIMSDVPSELDQFVKKSKFVKQNYE